MPGVHFYAAHVSEVEVHVEGSTLAELFSEAGQALAELLSGGAPPLPEGEAQTFALAAPDRDALLVEWLNELIYRAEKDRRPVTGFAFERLSDRELVARVRAGRVPELRPLVKAATYHGLRIEDTAHGYSANIILDV